ncbi:MAG: hypothetical protein WCA27_12335 [Candidatus Sulfotelmatobacter sp.]
MRNYWTPPLICQERHSDNSPRPHAIQDILDRTPARAHVCDDVNLPLHTAILRVVLHLRRQVDDINLFAAKKSFPSRVMVTNIASSLSAPGIGIGCDTSGRSALTPW